MGMYVRACVIMFGVWTVSDSVRFVCLFRPSTLALRCLGFITGAGALARRLGFGCMYAARVPVAPAVDAVPLCLWLVPQWLRVRCDVCVVCWFKLMGPIGIDLSARHRVCWFKMIRPRHHCISTT